MRLVRYIPDDEMPEEVKEVTNSSPASEAESQLASEQPEQSKPAELTAEVPAAEVNSSASADAPEQPEPSEQADQTESATENAVPQASDQADPSQPVESSEQQDGPVIDTPEEAAAATDAAEESDAEEPEVDLLILESLLFSTHHPLTGARLAELMDLPGSKPLRKAIKTLNTQYEETRRSFRIEQVAGGYQLLTLPEYGEYLKRLHQREADAKLTKAALETLAIVAYKQPILRAEVESIRGVACGETIRSLMEKHLVKIAGRAEEPGRPILYGTTKRFLELFGLNSLKDLPKPEEAALSPKQPARSSPTPPQPASAAPASDTSTPSEAPAADQTPAAEQDTAAPAADSPQ